MTQVFLTITFITLSFIFGRSYEAGLLVEQRVEISHREGAIQKQGDEMMSMIKFYSGEFRNWEKRIRG